MKNIHHRKAFSMLTAIVIIVLMSSVAMLIMNMSGKLIKETTAQYQREQAILLANSYTEYAIMAVTANRRAVACLQTINGTMGDAVVGGNPNNGYNIRINIAYIGTAAVIGTCLPQQQLGIHANADLPLTIIIDAYVDYNDLDNPAVNPPVITYHRRTVQKI